MKQKFILGVVALLVTGGLTGFGVFWLFQSQFTPKCVSNFELINPEPDCEVYDERSAKLEALQDALEKKVSQLESREDTERVAVFVRDLTTRRFAGVNDDKVFVLASLLKVPILIAYYKFAEVEPAILTDEVEYTGVPNEYNTQEEEPPDKHLEIGVRYSIEELLFRAVAYSDNTASAILLSRMSDKFIGETLSSLGIQVERLPGEKEALITARTYASIFRGLYNASYVSRQYSEKALTLLTQSTFKDGTRTVVPSYVKVAEKFGERTNVDEKGTVLSRQLHDCGIVYANKGKAPYTFCIMTEGHDYESLKTAIQEVAEIVYKTLGE